MTTLTFHTPGVSGVPSASSGASASGVPSVSSGASASGVPSASSGASASGVPSASFGASPALIPPFLKKGDKVALVSPSGPVAAENVDYAVKVLEEFGLECAVSSNALKRCGPCAGTDFERLGDLQRALDETEIRAVLCTRGGYGMGRIIDAIDFTRFMENPKWVVGFSDITVLHSRLARLGVSSLHAVMPNSYRNNAEAVESLRKALFGERLSYTLPSHGLNRCGTATAPLTGGNLSMLYSQRGTPTDINPSGKILFIEDLGEYDYHIDRMLSNLARGGWFENLAGLLVGSFSNIGKGANPCVRTVEETIRDYAKDYGYPVCFGFPAGHIARNLALYFGMEASLVLS